MIDERICQLCGQDVGREGAKYVEETFDVPYCPICEKKILTQMKAHWWVILDLEQWENMKKSPLKLVRKCPPGPRKKNCVYLP